jgi:hypothetical protein
MKKKFPIITTLIASPSPNPPGTPILSEESPKTKNPPPTPPGSSFPLRSFAVSFNQQQKVSSATNKGPLGG